MAGLGSHLDDRGQEFERRSDAPGLGQAGRPGKPTAIAELLSAGAAVLVVVGVIAIVMLTLLVSVIAAYFAGIAAAGWTIAFAVLLVAVLVSLARAFGSTHPASGSHCPNCDYQLAGLPPAPDGCTVCPECGAAWKLAQPHEESD